VFIDWVGLQEEQYGVCQGLTTYIQLVATRAEGTPEIYDTGLNLRRVEQLVRQIIPQSEQTERYGNHATQFSTLSFTCGKM